MPLNNLKLPSWLIQGITTLMQTAEDLFTGTKTGAAKKAWVKQATLDLLEKINIAVIPDFIEPPLKEAMVEVAIEVIWALLFAQDEAPRSRLAEVMSGEPRRRRSLVPHLGGV